MLPQIQAHWLQKSGNAPTEYEDAFSCPKHLSDDWEAFRIAIADGATETSFAREWANLLARSFGRYGLSDDPHDLSLVWPRKLWKRLVARRPLPWYAEEKAAMGAYSSLLGITVFKSEGSGYWKAIAVGDSCVFQVRGDVLVEAFPFVSSDAFNSRPELLGSVGDDGLAGCSVLTRTGSWQPGDVFYLMTDALACWFLKRRELLDDPLRCLRRLQGQEGFQEFIAEQRQISSNEDCCRLKNDDVTLVSCEMAD